MLDQKMLTAINKQINHELAAAYNYLAMAAHFENKNLQGFAQWMYRQRDEEHLHAQKFIDYILDRGGEVDMRGIEKPTLGYDSTLSVFKRGLEMEQLNTRTINELYALSRDLSDFATESFLKWFIDEQVEEEKQFEEAIAKLEMAGDNPSALLLLNSEFGSRPPEGV